MDGERAAPNAIHRFEGDDVEAKGARGLGRTEASCPGPDDNELNQ
jgi:hypothetical protein